MRAADCFRQDLSEPRCSDMAENINFHFDVDGENFSSAGEASIEVKKRLPCQKADRQQAEPL